MRNPLRDLGSGVRLRLPGQRLDSRLTV